MSNYLSARILFVTSYYDDISLPHTIPSHKCFVVLVGISLGGPLKVGESNVEFMNECR